MTEKKRRGPKPAVDRDEWQRATFFVRKKYLARIKEHAYRNRKTIKKIIDEALGRYLENKQATQMGHKED